MPGLSDRVIGHRFLSPVEVEAELGLVASNITHGDMLTSGLFAPRPHPSVVEYRAPLTGLYVSGAGTWPGGYVTGLPGYNVSRVVVADRRAHPNP